MGKGYSANSFTLDDSGVNSIARGGITNLTPNADSVEEVRVAANNFSAVDGRNSGAQIQVISKSGTNQFHGGASYHLARTAPGSVHLANLCFADTDDASFGPRRSSKRSTAGYIL